MADGSRFVSAGTAEEPPDRDGDWLAAQRELDESALRRKQESAHAGSGLQEGGRTLFEVLQANKAAKQDAFEESAKLKNQFRSLDEDEVDFLDSVLESTRKKEEEVRKETSEQLEAFRRQREEAERKVNEEAQDAEDEGVIETQAWRPGGRKRKKKDKEGLKGIKMRKTSWTDIAITNAEVGDSTSQKVTPSTRPSPAGRKSDEQQINAGRVQSGGSSTPLPKSPLVSAGLGLAGYSSDED